MLENHSLGNSRSPATTIRDNSNLEGFPDTTGDYAADNRAGRDYGEKFIAFMRTNDASCKLGHAVLAITGEPLNGVQVGFFAVIAERAMREVVPVVRAG